MVDRRSGSLIFATLVWAVASTALAQQPPPADPGPPKNETPRPQQTPTPDQRGTEQAPIIVKIRPSAKSQAEAAQEAKEREEKALAEKRLVELTGATANATIALVIVGILQFVVFAIQAGLFFAQLRIMRGSLTTSGLAATAATDNARASLASVEAMKRAERAYVAISHNPPGVWFQQESEGRIRFGVHAQILNSGRTPGTVVDLRLKAHPVLRDEQLPATPDYSESQPLESAKAFLVPSAAINANEPLGYLSQVEMTMLRSGELRLFVYGYVEYIDKFEDRHRGGYGRVFAPAREQTSNNLVFMTEGAYNYDITLPAASGQQPQQQN